MPKRKNSSSSPAGFSKRKRPTNDAIKLESPNEQRHEKVNCKGAAQKKRANATEQERPHRFLSCIIPERMQYAEISVTKEVMPDLERLGLKGLVNRPWQLKSRFACQEYLDFVKQTRPFPASHRVHLVKFDKEALAALYALPTQGYMIRPRQASICEGYPSKFFTGRMPKRGWFFSDVRDPRLMKIFMVLNPILSPDKYGQIKKTIAVAVCMAWSGEKIDWAGIMAEGLDHLTTNFGIPRKCFLSPYLLHIYQKVESLSMMEDYQIRKAEKNLDEDAKRAHESDCLRKQKADARADIRVKTGGNKQMQERNNSEAQQDEFIDLSGASYKAGYEGMSATGNEEEKICEEYDDDIDDDTSRTQSEEARPRRAGAEDPTEIDVVSISPKIDVKLNVDDIEIRDEINRVVNGNRDASPASSGDIQKHTDTLPPADFQQMETLKSIPESTGMEQQCFPAPGSISYEIKLLVSKIAKLENLVDDVSNKLGCSMDGVPSGIDAIQDDRAKLSADLQQSSLRNEALLEQLTARTLQLETQKQETESELGLAQKDVGMWQTRYWEGKNSLEEKNKLIEEKEIALNRSVNVNVSLAASVADLERQLGAMREKLEAQENRSISDEKADRTSAAPVIQRLQKDLMQSQMVRDDALSAMSRVYTLNMSRIDCTLGKFQNLLQDFEDVPGGLENLVKRKLKDYSEGNPELLLRKVANEIASARGMFNSTLSDSRKELDGLFVLAKDMRDAICSSSLTVSGGNEISKVPQRNDRAFAREVLLDAGMQLQAEMRNARCDQGLEFQSPPSGSGGHVHANVLEPTTGSGSGSPAGKLAVKVERVNSSDGWVMMGATGRKK